MTPRRRIRTQEGSLGWALVVGWVWVPVSCVLTVSPFAFFSNAQQKPLEKLPTQHMPNGHISPSHDTGTLKPAPESTHMHAHRAHVPLLAWRQPTPH